MSGPFFRIAAAITLLTACGRNSPPSIEPPAADASDAADAADASDARPMGEADAHANEAPDAGQPDAAAAGQPDASGEGPVGCGPPAGCAPSEHLEAASCACVPNLTATATQILLVVSSDWTAVPATLAAYQSKGPGGPWTPVGSPFPVVLGHAGLGWGRGLHPAPPAGDPAKHEGDGRSPAGVFELRTAFGYAAPPDSSWVKLSYLQATTDLECVDDAQSMFYNQTLYRSSLPVSGPGSPDWSSSEIMLRPDDAYKYGVIVSHNSAAPVPGGGSCIFLHLWSGPKSSTVGCTAGEESNMKAVIGWLDPARSPLLVQLPLAVYQAVRGAWGVP